MGSGNLLDVQVVALSLTLVIVGALLARNAFLGNYIGKWGLVSTNDQYPVSPQWYHRLLTFLIGFALLILGVWTILRIF